MSNKFNARKVEYDGFTFDSQAEYRRYCELKILEAAGEIAFLVVHPEYELLPKFTDNEGVKERAVTYTPDFSYREMRTDGSSIAVVEEVKSEETAKKQDYVIRRKLFKQKYGYIHFREIVS